MRLFDRWLAARNRMLSDGRFQRWAAKSWLFRGIARRRASALFDLCAGFVYSQVLLAVAQLGLLERLRDGPRTAASLSPELGLSESATVRLLDAAASLGLVEPTTDGRYALGIHGCSYVGNPAVARMVEHHAMLYRDLADPVALLRGEVQPELNRFWSYARRDDAAPVDGAVEAYSTLMAASVGLLADDVLDAYPVDRHRRLLDVGGGEGAFLEVVARRAPSLELMLFDLPPVASRASTRLSEAGLSKIDVRSGDLFRDPLPDGADLVTLVRVLHDHDDAQAERVLRAVHRALPPGGAVLVAEPMRGTKGAEAMGDAYFGLYLMAMGQGRPRSRSEVSALLGRAGFSRIRPLRTPRPMISQVISARREESVING